MALGPRSHRTVELAVARTLEPPEVLDDVVALRALDLDDALDADLGLDAGVVEREVGDGRACPTAALSAALLPAAALADGVYGEEHVDARLAPLRAGGSRRPGGHVLALCAGGPLRDRVRATARTGVRRHGGQPVARPLGLGDLPQPLGRGDRGAVDRTGADDRERPEVDVERAGPGGVGPVVLDVRERAGHRLPSEVEPDRLPVRTPGSRAVRERDQAALAGHRARPRE